MKRPVVRYARCGPPPLTGVRLQAAVGPLAETEIGSLNRLMIGLADGLLVFVPEWMSPTKQRASVFQKETMKFLERVVAGEKSQPTPSCASHIFTHRRVKAAQQGLHAYTWRTDHIRGRRTQTGGWGAARATRETPSAPFWRLST